MIKYVLLDILTYEERGCEPFLTWAFEGSEDGTFISYRGIKVPAPWATLCECGHEIGEHENEGACGPDGMNVTCGCNSVRVDIAIFGNIPEPIKLSTISDPDWDL
jgi:hypothetical protein